ncbi:inosine/xanthosine triphosphatase [Halarchaeum sp. P4]|uniref:inosine/xanthosine triphosphatase n=1 Tax=Halarchaeum sp. P4 TaxID=3421639 RepID=UPI003EBA6E99
MRVAVGSGNPVKRAATERVLGDGHTVVAESVPSGVSEQPWGEAETVEGAANRARRALAAGDYDLGVGLEGGVARVEHIDGLFLTMWAAVTDGERVEYGAGPRLRLPESVARRVDAGEELGPVMDDEYDMENVAENEGAAGVLTAGAMDRTSALEHAVAGALGPFVAD